MARNSSKVNRLAIKEMVEGWEGRKLPKNISMKALIAKVVDEAELTEPGREGDHGTRRAEAQNE